MYREVESFAKLQPQLGLPLISVYSIHNVLTIFNTEKRMEKQIEAMEGRYVYKSHA